MHARPFHFALLAIGILAFALPFDAHAAYRVYKLKITHYDAKGKEHSVQYVLSSLDQAQYEGYYGAYRWDKVEMLDTWYCPGDTSRRGYCPKPKVYDIRSPASDPGNRSYLPYNRQPVIP